MSVKQISQQPPLYNNLPIYVLGIDPGTLKSAYVLIEYYPANDHYPEKITILEKHLTDNETCVKYIETFYDRPQLFRIDIAAIEMMSSYGNRIGASVLETCVHIGIFAKALENIKLKTSFLFRKRHICKTLGGKNDKEIRGALLALLGPPGTKKNPGPTYGIANDMWSALGVAIVQARLFGETAQPLHIV